MEKKNKNIQIVELGIKSFTDALLMQEKYFNEIINIKRYNRKSENKTVTKNFMLWGRAHASYNPWEKWKR